ncbi:hypothetical protein CH293_05190 [Rhodococcus sp. 14-2470-1b]|nr:hypothetical protein CH293_05190 [Rhodococcus sp. 14-2470-1b]
MRTVVGENHRSVGARISPRGDEALRPKRSGRGPAPSGVDPGEASELDRLRGRNERVRTQMAYLGELRASRELGRR